MNRKEFIKSCGLGCLSLAGILPLLEGCTGVKQVQLVAVDRALTINNNEFLKDVKKPGLYRRAISVKTENLNYPILVYRFSDNDYRAFLLQCPHQGAELSVHGDIISCPAHGSEFNNRGEVTQGPAESNLREFKVTQGNQEIIIVLT